MEHWLILTVAIIIATRLLATSKPAGSSIACRDEPPQKGWTPALIGFAALAGIVGLFVRLVGFGSSLAEDEFGTLWTVEGSLGTVFERTLSFHGQSPFYYVISWLSLNLFGESEIALRLPSLLCCVGAAWLI